MASDPLSLPLIKICGITRNEDALIAERLGADFLGFIMTLGFGRSLPPERAVEVARGTQVARVAVLVNESVEEGAALARAVDASVVQLHGTESPAAVSAMRDLGHWRVWKAVRARSVDDVRRAVVEYGSHVDGLLVEGWKEGVTGGGGIRLDLDAEAVRDAVPEDLTFVLAGGLTADNVAGAIQGFRPHVVDVSSGVEREVGRKDERLLTRFFAEARP